MTKPITKLRDVIGIARQSENDLSRYLFYLSEEDIKLYHEEHQDKLEELKRVLGELDHTIQELRGKV